MAWFGAAFGCDNTIAHGPPSPNWESQCGCFEVPRFTVHSCCYPSSPGGSQSRNNFQIHSRSKYPAAHVQVAHLSKPASSQPPEWAHVGTKIGVTLIMTEPPINKMTGEAREGKGHVLAGSSQVLQGLQSRSCSVSRRARNFEKT